MDSYPHHQQPQNWYPSSSPPPPPPPPPPPGGGVGGGGYHQLPSGYPPIPHHHQWPPPDSRHHHPHQFQSPPPYGLSSSVPSPYSAPPPPSHLQQHQQQYPSPPLPPRPQYPMPPPPPPPQQQMAHQHPPPPHSSFPPPNHQAWGNPSWGQHQGWAHPDINIPYNNEEDWAARARAWAAAKSGTENHHTQPHFAPTWRADEHNYAYQDHYQQTFDARTDMEQHSRPQSSIQHLPITSSGSSSYSTGYRAGDEAIASDRDHMASPQKRYVPSASIYEQEVPYSYSSAPGKREVFNQVDGSHVPMPLPMPSIQGHHSLPSVPIQMSSAEQPHFTNHGPPKDFLSDARDRPLEFEPRSSSDHESYEKLSYGLSGPTGVLGVMDHDMHVPPISSWSTSTAATGAGYPQLPLGPSGTQFDASFIPQASLPVHPAPVFVGMPVPSFQHNMPHASAPFGLGPGSSLNHSAAFPVDANGGLSLPERPKKAAVPNWLREEIIKKKAVVSSTVPMQSTGSSLDCVGPEDSDKSLRRADQADSKSIDSTKSTEDEEDDEEDVEAARSAAINQEIKRVLTEVLLKVTDELFEEIATKVLNEDKLTVEVEENPVHGKQVSSPAETSTPKASARILVPVKRENNKVDGVAEDSSTSSPGGDILGLGNYASDASDDDGDDKMQNSTLLPSGKKSWYFQSTGKQGQFL
ncbi:Uncharacterized protein M6B38_215340 [Iris pallida]|uniref:Uncharacterized protein n=1 Tax=Iris pallida TaxID=29817 RepID=A0AAX6E127_IRIPA|nr:Uncharacterized protein M6B38_215340 [Iris pallida]